MSRPHDAATARRPPPEPARRTPNEVDMRPLLLAAAALAACALQACGHTTVERTVVVTPPAGSTVVVPHDGQPRVVPPGG